MTPSIDNFMQQTLFGASLPAPYGPVRPMAQEPALGHELLCVTFGGGSLPLRFCINNYFATSQVRMTRGYDFEFSRSDDRTHGGYR